MSQEGYQLWKVKLDNLKKKLAEEPENLSVARELWEKLQGPKDFNYKSGNLAISIFKQAAVRTNEGVIQLAHAFKELVQTTGEKPRKESFDEELRLALTRACKELNDPDKTIVTWLYESIS